MTYDPLLKQRDIHEVKSICNLVKFYSDFPDTTTDVLLVRENRSGEKTEVPIRIEAYLSGFIAVPLCKKE